MSNIPTKIRADLAKLERGMLREITDLFARARSDIISSIVLGAPEINTALNYLLDNYYAVVTEGMLTAASVGQSHFLQFVKSEYAEHIPKKSLVQMTTAPLSKVPEQVVSAAEHRIWDDRLRLKDRVWAHMGGELKSRIENRLVVGTAQGADIRQIAKEIKEDFDAVKDWQALRLARTEIMSAHRHGLVEAAREKSWVTGFRRVLSNASPCEVCEELAGEYGLDDVPVDSHPNCACIILPILAPPEDVVV